MRLIPTYALPPPAAAAIAPLRPWTTLAFDAERWCSLRDAVARQLDCAPDELGRLHAVEALGLRPDQCAMVGDRLYTDIAMANRAGVVGVLVLSGEATREDVQALPADALQTPDVIVESVDALMR